MIIHSVNFSQLGHGGIILSAKISVGILLLTFSGGVGEGGISSNNPVAVCNHGSFSDSTVSGGGSDSIELILSPADEE